MIYFLEFLGFLGVAMVLAASPLLIRLFEMIIPRAAKENRSARYQTSLADRVAERSEVRAEIRRMTDILEVRADARRR